MIKLLCIVVIVMAASVYARADEKTRLVIYDGIPTEVATDHTGSSPDLWITDKDLTRATRFAIKPQGVCRDELCFPLPKNRKADFISRRSGVTWFNLTEFARLIKQPFASDQKNGIWYFGPRSDEQNTYLISLHAPNFTLPDLQGNKHSLSDFRGKKVLLITWASW